MLYSKLNIFFKFLYYLFFFSFFPLFFAGIPKKTSIFVKKLYAMKTIVGFLMCLMVANVAVAQQISIEDITSGEYRPKSIKSMNPLADGETYARISSDGKKIEKCAFKNGEVVATLFDISTARNYKLDSFDGYIMSPDEQNILIETDGKQIYRNSRVATYYIYNVRNNTLAPLSNGGPQECPKFSPDGNVIAFVRDGNLFIVKLLFNNAESQVTKDGANEKILNGKADWVYEEEFTMNRAFDFSANSEMIAWMRFDETDVPLYNIARFDGTVDSYKYPLAGQKNPKVTVHTFDIKSRVTREIKISTDYEYIPRIQFTGNGDKLMVLTLNRHQDKLDFYLADARSTTANLLLRETTDCYVEQTAYDDIDFKQPQFVLLSERDGFRHIYLYDTQTGQLKKQLTSGSFEVTKYYGQDAAGKYFYFASNEGSPLEQYVCKVDASGKRTKITTEKGFHSAMFSKGCNYFVHTYSNLSTPPVVSVCAASGKTLKVVEDNAALKSKLSKLQLGDVELFSFTTTDGIQLNGWMVKPVGFNPSKKYPVLMYQYSGPGNQQVHNSFSNGFFGTLAWEQRMAQKGYLVVCVDGRGTGGRGAQFQRATYKKMGTLESRDQAETALYLSSLSYVDKSRIAIWGWSFGGFNTIMSMCEGRGLFRCGVAVAPVTDWRYYDSAYTERYMCTPQENSSGYDSSPLHHYQKLQGDLLIVHGTADDNVHYQNTAELTEAMVQAGIQFEMQVYTDRNHNITGGNTRNHLFTRIENYLDRHLLTK